MGTCHPPHSVLPQTSTRFAIATRSELGRAGASQRSAWIQAQHQDSSTHLYPVIFHVFHTGHSDEGRSPPVHCLQLHVDQEAVGCALGPGRTWVSGEQGRASGSHTPRQLSQQCALLKPSSQPWPVWVRAIPAQRQQERVGTGLPGLSCVLTRWESCAQGKKVSKRQILGIYIAATLGWTQLLLLQLETTTTKHA